MKSLSFQAVQKDLWAAEKLVSCAGLSAWIPSITNMMWWSFSSSKGFYKRMKNKKIEFICRQY